MPPLDLSTPAGGRRTWEGAIRGALLVAAAVSVATTVLIVFSLIRETVTRTLAAADGNGVTPLAAAFHAGREFLAESGADDELLDELFVAG